MKGYKDFLYLNVPGILTRFNENSSEYDERYILTKTEVEFLKKYGLLRPDAQAWIVPHGEVKIFLSDLTDEGQEFIMSKATHSWLQCIDRKGKRIDHTLDDSGLVKRLKKFKERNSKK